MLTKLRIRNFKCLKESEILLDSTVVFVGPNKSKNNRPTGVSIVGYKDACVG